jgi:ACS family tartrate transporter-like MFS transporter
MSPRENVCLTPGPSPEPIHDPDLEARILWKVTLRLIPFLFLLYVMNILDRVNVGFARLGGMLPAMNVSKADEEAVFSFGGGVFFIGYFIFEVPSNLMLRRTGARRWIARILVSWGLISAGMMFVTAPWNFYLLRFLLGVAEAGFFPGIILYLSYWFPARQRARAVSRFMTGSAVTGMVGLPLSGAIMEFMNGTGGLAGWQWLFLLEGLPTAVLGIVALYYLTDRPEQAQWLTPTERSWLAEHLRHEETDREQRHGYTLRQAVTNPRVWLLCLLYFTVSMGANSYGLYLPTILKDSFKGSGEFRIGLLGAIPSIVTIVAMVLVGFHSDRTGERRWHVAVPAFVAAAGWVMVAEVGEPHLVLVGLAMAQAGMLSMLAPFWSLPTSFLSGAAAAGGIAFINSVGNLGGFVAPKVIGRVKALTDSFSGGFLFLAGALVVGGFLALAARHERARERPAAL